MYPYSGDVCQQLWTILIGSIANNYNLSKSEAYHIASNANFK